MDASTLTGQCLCGDVKFSIEKRPQATLLCYCRRCRIYTGSEGSHLAVFPRDDVTFVEGSIEGNCSSFQKREANRTWCKRCGTSLFDQRGDKLFVSMGCLDEPHSLELKHYVLADERASYALNHDEMKAFELPAAARAAAEKAKAQDVAEA
jgi:hypothetical protein